MLFIYFHKLSRSISDHHLRCEKHPIVEFSCNVKTARPLLKTDTIAAIEKKKKKKKKKKKTKKKTTLLRTRASVHKQLEYYSFQNFEYDYIKMRANRARKDG